MVQAKDRLVSTAGHRDHPRITARVIHGGESNASFLDRRIV